MPAKTKTAKTKTAKKPSKAKSTSAKKKTSSKKKATTKKKTVAKKAAPKKTAKKKPAAKKTSTAKKKKPAAKKKASSTKKKTTRKKSTKSTASPKIHLSEFVSPMTVVPFDIEDAFAPEAIDLNDLPSMEDAFDMPEANAAVMPVALPSRLSFYMGVFFGAIVLHALMISVLAIMSA